jgi:prefoldin subunit 5
MAVIQTTVNELLELTQGVKNIKVQNLRTTIDYANRKIISLQRHLENLRSAYTLIKQNIYRDQTFEDLNTTPDQYQTIDPIQSIQHYDVMPSDPDPRINWARRRLEESIALSKRHLEKIDEEIKSTSADITKLTYEKQQAIEELATIADVNVAVSRDNIVKSQYSITYMLYEIHKKYRD